MFEDLGGREEGREGGREEKEEEGECFWSLCVCISKSDSRGDAKERESEGLRKSWREEEACQGGTEGRAKEGERESYVLVVIAVLGPRRGKQQMELLVSRRKTQRES